MFEKLLELLLVIIFIIIEIYKDFVSGNVKLNCYHNYISVSLMLKHFIVALSHLKSLCFRLTDEQKENGIEILRSILRETQCGLRSEVMRLTVL